VDSYFYPELTPCNPAMSEQPKVIIRCLVYNHEPYLRDCLEGFVMQQTNFPFKAVVHDDCSTDNSAAIIREYAEKYPHIIEPIYETENQYSKRDGSLGRVMDAATLGRSPYIAYCEGDDYWIDPLKLQKQVDFLDENPDYAMCFSSCEIKKEEEHLHTGLQNKLEEDKDFSASELMATWRVPTASICAREGAINDERITKFDKRKACGDLFIVLTCAHRGKVRGMKDVMTVYRVNGGSVMQNKSDNRIRYEKRALLPHFNFIEEHYPLVDKKVLSVLRMQTYLSIAENPLFPITERTTSLIKAAFVAPGALIKKTWTALKLSTKRLIKR